MLTSGGWWKMRWCGFHRHQRKWWKDAGASKSPTTMSSSDPTSSRPLFCLVESVEENAEKHRYAVLNECAIGATWGAQFLVSCWQSMGLSPKVWQFLFFLSLCCIDLAGLVWRLFEVSEESWNIACRMIFPLWVKWLLVNPKPREMLGWQFGWLHDLFICCS